MIFSRSLFALIILSLLTACSTTTLTHQPLPAGKAGEAKVTGYSSDIRSWGDEAPKNLSEVVAKHVEEYSALNSDYYSQHKKYPPMQYLALSGGGNDGAFGAGILCGWTKSGTRPTFTVVTGVSTGALIAPFAFLGPDYDQQLKEVYTTVRSENILLSTTMTVLDGITGGLALADSSPLAKRIEQVVTPEMLQKIAAEHRKGRRLLIGTTNIEAQRNMIWDIGAIANSGHPHRLQLVRDILLASAAVPGLVKPVFIDVTLDGKRYTEIHADGGVTTQVFLSPLQSIAKEKSLFEERKIPRKLYIIRNTKIAPEYKPINPGFFSITQRSLETVIKYSGLGDLYRLYVGAKRDGIEYNLVYIPKEFEAESRELFDPAYMQKVFDMGYEMGRQGVEWENTPPGVKYLNDKKKNKPETPGPA